MKKILVTGANSYIGTNFENYIRFFDNYDVTTLDMLDDAWVEFDFSAYDVVFHVAGIAHQKETKKNMDLYYKVNRDLAIETALKAKQSGVRQFVLLSSMSVFGMRTGEITWETVPNPTTNYGKSKLAADIEILKMSDDNFRVAVLRPPMVYGDGCKGNYQLLRKIALNSPIFPNIRNQRSMIYINTLCEFVKSYIDNDVKGLFYPQDNEYVCTSDMVKQIADDAGKKIILTKAFNFIFKSIHIKLFDKVFGDLIYKQEMFETSRTENFSGEIS